MENGLVVTGALILIAYVAIKLKSLFYKAKADELAKEGETLKKEQTVIETEVKVLKDKLNEPVKDLTPEQIEAFWNEDKK